MKGGQVNSYPQVTTIGTKSIKMKRRRRIVKDITKIAIMGIIIMEALTVTIEVTVIIINIQENGRIVVAATRKIIIIIRIASTITIIIIANITSTVSIIRRTLKIAVVVVMEKLRVKRAIAITKNKLKWSLSQQPLKMLISSATILKKKYLMMGNGQQGSRSLVK
jgi:hypothetical protein